MCLSTVFEYHDSPDNAQEVCSNVTNFEVQGDRVVFTDLLGQEYVVKGTVTQVDFVKSRIYVGL